MQYLDKIEDKGLVGTPDIVIETLSPSTSQLDYEEKKLDSIQQIRSFFFGYLD